MTESYGKQLVPSVR